MEHERVFRESAVVRASVWQCFVDHGTYCIREIAEELEMDADWVASAVCDLFEMGAFTPRNPEPLV